MVRLRVLGLIEIHWIWSIQFYSFSPCFKNIFPFYFTFSSLGNLFSSIQLDPLYLAVLILWNWSRINHRLFQCTHFLRDSKIHKIQGSSYLYLLAESIFKVSSPHWRRSGTSKLPFVENNKVKLTVWNLYKISEVF